MTTHCNTCEHKRYPNGGHCYMHRHAPSAVCQAHTGHRAGDVEVMMATAGTYEGQRAGRTLAIVMALHC